MTETRTTPSSTTSTRGEARRVLLITLVLNFAVALGKIALGLITGALAITADGFHSLMDGTSNVVGLIASVIADRPPDDDHPYGHERFETLAALLIGALLLLTAWEIVQGAIERLNSQSVPEITPLTFVVLIGTLVVNLFVSTYERRAGTRLKSQILLADAANTSADVFVTLSVLVSMAFVALGWYWVDTLAALIVVVLIGRAAWEILQKTGSILVDTAPYTPDELTALVEAMPCVEQVSRARSRGSVDAAHIDIDVQIAPEMTAEQTAHIADAIREHLDQNLGGVAEVEVHFVPEMNSREDYALAARACADALGLATHEVHVSEMTDASQDPGKLLELHVEVPSGQTLAEAHQQVSQLEQQIQEKIPGVAQVVTHIEPAVVKGELLNDSGAFSQATQIEHRARFLLNTHYPDIDWHDLQALPNQGGIALMMHVTLPSQISIESAHQIAEAAETMLRSDMPHLERVTIHTEPPDDTP